MPAATFYLAPILTVGIDKRIPRSRFVLLVQRLSVDYTSQGRVYGSLDAMKEERKEKERGEKRNHCHALGKKEKFFRFAPWYGRIGTPTRFGSRNTN